MKLATIVSTLGLVLILMLSACNTSSNIAEIEYEPEYEYANEDHASSEIEFESEPEYANENYASSEIEYEPEPEYANENHTSSEVVGHLLSIQNAQGNVIYYGMARSDVEYILGPGMSDYFDEESFGANVVRSYFSFEEGGDMEIVYVDGHVVIVTVNEVLGWKTSSGIEVMVTTLEEVMDIHSFYLYDRGWGEVILFFDHSMTPIHVEDPFEDDWEYAMAFLVRRQLYGVDGFVDVVVELSFGCNMAFWMDL